MPPAERVRASPSVSRAGSVTPSASMQGFHRSPSAMTLRESTPTPSTPRGTPRPSASSIGSASLSTSPAKPATTLLHCTLCQRRIGLWAFLPPLQSNGRSPSPEDDSHQSIGAKVPQRQLNILGEHRSYCPYTMRSTVLPSMPTPPMHKASDSQLSLSNASSASLGGQPGVMEGWRAVLAVVLRYGMVRRQRLGLTRAQSGRVTNGGEEQSPEEVDAVEAMVNGVKARGVRWFGRSVSPRTHHSDFPQGKDLLKYVKGLLG